MSAGNFYTRVNSNDTTAVPNAGTNLDVSWDTEEYNDGNIVTYTNPNLRVGVGLYLIMYSDQFYTADTTANRIEIQGEIHTVQGGLQGGFGSDYIRKSNGQQECIVSGSLILNVTSANTDIFVRFYRTDSVSDLGVNRVVDYGGITILQLDSTHNYGLYSTSASEATSGTTERTLNLDTNNRQDTGFSRTGTSITVSNAGRYLISYEMDISQTSTAREVVTSYIRKNGTTEINGTRAFSYMRGSNGCQDSALTWTGIVDISANDVLDVRWSCPSNTTITASANAKFQIWQIPTTADTAIMEANTGDYNKTGVFDWDTLPHIDTTSFTATAGTSNIDVNQMDHCLAFANFAQVTDSSVARAYPMVGITNNSTLQKQCFAGGYHRASGTSNFAVGVSGLIHTILPDTSVEIYTSPLGASGTLANTKGLYSVLSLASIWSYNFSPIIVSTNDVVLSTSTNVKIVGMNFKATQGVGKVELWSDTTGTTKVQQTITSWSDTEIQYNVVVGTLTNGIVYVVVTDSGGLVSDTYKMNLGLLGYRTIVDNLLPDHYWKLNNDYLDSGNTGPARDMNVSVVGTHGFVTTLISEDTTYSLLFDDILDKREISDSVNINIATLYERTMGGWVQLGGIQKTLGSIFKEGGSVQNLAFFVGIGNVLIAQMADSDAGNNAQAWSDFRLTPNRPYHIIFRYSQRENPKEFRLYIDGREQTLTDGNPNTGNDFTSHGGDCVWGDPDNNLETGGTDIAYRGMENCLYSNWATWSNNSSYKGALDKELDIKNNLFRRGAIPEYTISSGIQSAMQSSLDTTLQGVEIGDVPLGIRIEDVTGNGDLELTAKDITFNPRCSDQLEWRGGNTLTWILDGTSTIDTDKIFASGGGNIIIKQNVTISVNVKDIVSNVNLQGARVYIITTAGGDLPSGTELHNGLTDVNGNISTSLLYTNDQPISGRVRFASSNYKTQNFTGVITNSGISLNILLIKDT
jgi:hypothetical protein